MLEEASGAAFPIVGVGASAGGLEALTALLKALPSDTGMAFVLVQHLAPTHASALAEILSRATRMPVTEAVDGEAVEPNHVYVIPPGQCMSIDDGSLHLVGRETVGQERVIDHFFRTLAEDARHSAIGVVLSGTATDGTLGLEAIKAESGITFAQDVSAQHSGMPNSAIASGCVDFVMSPEGIAGEIVRIGASGYAVPAQGGDATDNSSDHAPKFTEIVQLLHESTGVDFTHYKLNTFSRRVSRRMVLSKSNSIGDYLELLRKTPAEVEALYQDVLINVTSFFRNPEAFEALKSKVFPRLFAARARNEPMRMWTLGCSTGQEAYSLAIAFTEFAEDFSLGRGGIPPLQLFATDLNPANIDKARAGIYPKDIAQDLSPERLQRFFTEVNGGYRITKLIRDSCAFSQHNVLTDPPFSRMDLISCRNLLIYLEPVLQRRVLPTLHYALKADGCLWLGTSETIGGQHQLFEADDPKHKLYTKKPGATSGYIPPRASSFPRALFASPFITNKRATAQDGAPPLKKEAERILLSRFSPPAVVVSPDLEILHYHGDVSAYLTPIAGKPSLNLLKMLREGLLVAVNAAIARAAAEHAEVREENLRVKSGDGGYIEVAIEVLPLGNARSAAQGASREGAGFMILFNPAGALPQTLVAAKADSSSEPFGETERATLQREIAHLSQELADTREYLQALSEQQEAAYEELQSANEEVQSANEELQSTNEELQTSKEEIQSSNEELETVNDELNNRNAELSRLDDDHVNVIGSAQIPMVIIGPDFRIRSFTPTAEKLFRLSMADIGRPLRDIQLGLDPLPALEARLYDVLDTVTPWETEVRDARGHWHSLRLRPYRTLDNRIDGVVLMLMDIDVLKRAQEYADSVAASIDQPLLVLTLDGDLRVRAANEAFCRAFGIKADAIKSQLLFEIDEGQWNLPELRRKLEELLPRDRPIVNFEVRHEFDRIGTKIMHINARRLLQLSENDPAILITIEDITERHQTAVALRESEDRFRMLADNMSQFAWMADAKGWIFWYNKRWFEYTGTTLEQMQGWGWKAVHHPDHVDRVVVHVERAWDEGEAWEELFPLRAKDGSYRWFLTRAVPIRNEKGDLVRWLGTNTDVNDQRNAEESLKQADLHKNEFLAMLAHELRNPLAPIRNALQIMRLKPDNGESFESAFAMMERQLVQVVRLVDDLMDVSRISSGKIDLRRTRIELSSVVYQAVEAARPPIEAMKHELSLSLPPQPLYLNADPVRLAQVIGNLLNNACKFTEMGGRIALVVEFEKSSVVIRVSDNGLGIAANQLTHIFDMFVQVEDDALRRESGGLGLGLTLVRNLVEMHGGTVEAQSKGVGHGSEFAVRLPLLAETERNAPEPAPELRTAAVNGHRILVVDDNRDSADSMAMLFMLEGNETQTAYDGQAALETVAAFHPDVMLLDLGLPILNGYQVARELRAQSAGKELVLVALTGWGQAEAREKTRDAGFDGHLVKPVDVTALKALLAELASQPKDR